MQLGRKRKLVIITVCTDDDALLKAAKEASLAQPEVFGGSYRVFGKQIPMLGEKENLFLSAHGVYDGDDNNPVIGDKANALFLNGVQAFQALEGLFPPNYSGNVYISACEAADHADDDFSFAEVFKAQLQQARPQAGNVYAQAGSVGLRIPLPTDKGWVLA
jgi:hypothetical protein